MLTDEQLWKCTQEELIQSVQRIQHEKLAILHDHSNKMKDVNKRMQIHLLEIRNLKDINKKLQDDNQELRDLCCFLDDDRQKYRLLSREWQTFGRQASSVIRTEVSSSQHKLKSLSTDLDILLKDNEELKELVLYLDSERCSSQRDQGDGSSGNSEDPVSTALTSPGKQPSSAVSEETMKYIQHLEERTDLLENQLRRQLEKSADNPWLSTSNISQAMKVLEVHNRIERAPTSQSLDQAGLESPSESESLYSGSDRAPVKSARQYPGTERAPATHDRQYMGSQPKGRQYMGVNRHLPAQVRSNADAVDNSSQAHAMGSDEKTLLRELCNVAWRTLEDEATTKSRRPIIPQNSRV